MKAKILAAALIASGFSIAANAADTGTLTVQANVTGVCKFASNTATLTLANSGVNIDPSSGTNATGTTSMTYKCTKGETPIFANGNGLNYVAAGNVIAMKHATLAEYMPYTLTLTGSGTGNGFGNGAQTLNIAGTVVPANFQNASVGGFADTITITLTP